MKKIGKLQINPENILNNEELITLSGGYGTCTCMCWRGYGIELGYLLSSGDSGCHAACVYAWSGIYGDVGGYPVTPGCW